MKVIWLMVTTRLSGCLGLEETIFGLEEVEEVRHENADAINFLEQE